MKHLQANSIAGWRRKYLGVNVVTFPLLERHVHRLASPYPNNRLRDTQHNLVGKSVFLTTHAALKIATRRRRQRMGDDSPKGLGYILATIGPHLGSF